MNRMTTVANVKLSPLQPWDTYGESIYSSLMKEPIRKPPHYALAVADKDSTVATEFVTSLFGRVPNPRMMMATESPTGTTPATRTRPTVSSSRYAIFAPDSLYFRDSYEVSMTKMVKWRPE